ncbi:hypothetical protein ABZY57_30740 [Streptomyces sp. NPDC006450]|uniref:hypothetical protein n=1 Tax=Streptomyces sp. NPDC006450 TaxID=3155458 RepID=UPI0033A04F48
MTSPGNAADFRPTHIVPQDGLPAWETPDLSRPTVPLDAFLPVRLLSRRGEWGEILCANGWSAWVDGRLLLAVPQPPPTGGRPLTRVEDPQPLLARCTEELERYRRAVTDLAAGRIDPESFRRSLRGARVGVVVDGESVWLYDETAGRWMYGDGSRLATYAVVEGPGVPAAPGTPPEEADTEGGGDVRHVPHEPTKIVELPGPEAG